MYKLKHFRDDIEGMSDLLNWGALIDDGILLNKDGSFTAAYEFTGIDLSSSSNLDRNDICIRVNHAVQELGTGWMVHVDAIRQQSSQYINTQTHFSHPVMALIDDARRLFFEGQGNKFQSRYILALTYMPPSPRLNKLNDLMFEQDKTAPKDDVLTKNLSRFTQSLQNLISRLNSYLSITRLGAVYDKAANCYYDTMLSYLNFTVTGHWHPIRLPPCPMAIDSYIGCCDFLPDFTPTIDNRFTSVISIDGFPPQSHPQFFASLDDMACEYRWSTRFIFLDDISAHKHLDNERKKWKQKVISFKDKLLNTNDPQRDEAAASMVAQYEYAQTAINKGEVSYGQYSTTIILRHDNIDTLNAMTAYVTKCLRHISGLHCRVETVNATDAFLSTLPSDSVCNIRKPLLSTENLADLLPLNHIWTGNEHCPCPFYPPQSPPVLYASAKGSSVFRLNLHVDDVGHTLIFGPTGSGKSTLLALLAAQYDRYQGMTIYAFDKKCSLFTLSQCGGQHHDIGNGAVSSFAPLAEVDTDFEWCNDYIETLLTLQGVIVTPRHRQAIYDALNQMRTSDIKTLSEFHTQVQDAEIKEAIAYYTVMGAGGDLLDGETNAFGFAHFTVFEIDTLMKRGEKDAAPVLMYLFRQIERRLTGSPAVIFIDEGWTILMNSYFKAKLKEWLLELRKLNCIVVFATQMLSAAIDSGILDVLIESCPTHIFLPNKKAQQLSATYEAFGLNHKHIQTIKNAVKKREYVVVQDNTSRLIDLSLDALALAFVGVSDKPSIERVRHLVEHYGEDWYLHWLNEKGLQFE